MNNFKPKEYKKKIDNIKQLNTTTSSGNINYVINADDAYMICLDLEKHHLMEYLTLQKEHNELMVKANGLLDVIGNLIDGKQPNPIK